MDQAECFLRTEVRDKYLIIYLSGDITDVCEEKILAAYGQMEKLTLSALILDFEKVMYVNSAGIAVIINLLTKMRQKQHHLYISHLSDYLRKIFTMIGLTRYSTYYPTVEESITAIKREFDRV